MHAHLQLGPEELVLRIQPPELRNQRIHLRLQVFWPRVGLAPRARRRRRYQSALGRGSHDPITYPSTGGVGVGGATAAATNIGTTTSATADTGTSMPAVRGGVGNR
ncbi:hypothetical protein HYH02_010240 [Chlamydomonas schloesseri]|uniref:Uncharacterized protein n=1 Tax=Chlamydomonas schloesseri TaxID=2026947 RepID=A0A835TL65_9CHLO|nr:hypothetical protein HYH02_010240 [Chlamydomonas schloesseri]|eukprot:KAG2440661.1 hypothetical protein HYH02_010240 [Chlamydomonas schloesseri]